MGRLDLCVASLLAGTTHHPREALLASHSLYDPDKNDGYA